MPFGAYQGIAGEILIFPAIMSPNYVPGVSGWAIFSDGSAEFNDATFRGDVHVVDVNGQRIDIEVSGSDGAAIFFTPETVAGVTWQRGIIRADRSGANAQPVLSIVSPVNGTIGNPTTLDLNGATDAAHGSLRRRAILDTQDFSILAATYNLSVSPFDVLEDVSTGVLNLALAAAAVPGVSITFTVAGPNNAKVHVCGHADTEVLVSNAAVIAVGELVVDSVVQTKQILMGCALPVSSRNTVGQCWDLSLATGSHTITMQGRNTGVGAFARFNATHTNLVMTVIDC